MNVIKDGSKWGGQITPAGGGQFQSAGGGQFSRHMQHIPNRFNGITNRENKS